METWLLFLGLGKRSDVAIYVRIATSLCFFL